MSAIIAPDISRVPQLADTGPTGASGPTGPDNDAVLQTDTATAAGSGDIILAVAAGGTIVLPATVGHKKIEYTIGDVPSNNIVFSCSAAGHTFEGYVVSGNSPATAGATDNTITLDKTKLAKGDVVTFIGRSTTKWNVKGVFDTNNAATFSTV